MLVYAVKHKDDQTRACSRSGGIFTAISDLFLNGGVVYGCALDAKFVAQHIRVEDKAGRDKMRGSKYVQSQMGACFEQVKIDLEAGRKVLFSGTSCQVAGLRCYLQKEYSNLLCVDIVCHGVPSPKVWREYIQWQSRGKEIQAVDFRNKNKYGWNSHVETIFLKNTQIDSQVYVNITFGHNILRPCCYECPYKSIHLQGDISIGDYWGIENAAPGFDDNKGVSLVLVNTEKGQEYFEKAKTDVEWKETRIEDSMQHPFEGPFSDRKYYNEFWEDYNTKGFPDIVKKYSGYTVKFRIKQLIKRVLGKKYMNG